MVNKYDNEKVPEFSGTSSLVYWGKGGIRWKGDEGYLAVRG